MKNKSESRIGRTFRRIFNVRQWADVDRTKVSTNYLVDGIKKMTEPQKAGKNESFSAAVKRLNLNESELIARQNSLFYMSILMLLVAVGVMVYGFIHLVLGNFLATLISIVVVSIALSLAFRYHFWYFQIKHRKLGCTIQEWYRQGILGEKS